MRVSPVPLGPRRGCCFWQASAPRHPCTPGTPLGIPIASPLQARPCGQASKVVRVQTAGVENWAAYFALQKAWPMHLGTWRKWGQVVTEEGQMLSQDISIRSSESSKPPPW